MLLEELVSYFELAAYVIGILVGIDYIYKEYCVKNVEDLVDERISSVLTKRLSIRIKRGVNEGVNEGVEEEAVREDTPLLQEGEPLKISNSTMSMFSLLSSNGDISPTRDTPTIQEI